MSMKPYPIHCYTPECGLIALYKVASRWSDGLTKELKTYSLCCESCLPKLFSDAVRRQQACRLTEEESLEAPSIFDLVPGTRDRFLNPREDLARKFREATST
ncbi:hypothetical protein KIH39_16830 [Telmatocola sphagniphila]|uniref:Uncharacterized protein n=2 Tax=Telmatocola sphagniphila TaxID=1123043 RepID=A0A8E6ESC3_9BACT|nr:hypothetical protein KIH39_16830 [Telmatocola sphagniphila]